MPDHQIESLSRVLGVGGSTSLITRRISPYSLQTLDAQDTLPTFELVSGPAGMAVDPASGLVTWTPTLSDVGRPTATFRATNAIGSDSLALTFPVQFTRTPFGSCSSGARDRHVPLPQSSLQMWREFWKILEDEFVGRGVSNLG